MVTEALLPLLENLSTRRLALVTGGPGTGKTTMAARLVVLAAKRLLAQSQQLPSIALAAPTGKAAARLTEAFHLALQLLLQEESIPAELLVRLQKLQASTLHRLLGYSDQTDRFSHHERAPLHVDLLLIDESSMISMHLMQALFRALDTLGGQRPATQLILMGDAQQLAAVEIGSPFADLLAAASDADNALFGCALELKKQWRSGVKLAALSAKVRALIEATKADQQVDEVLTEFSSIMQTPDAQQTAQQLIVANVNAGLFDHIGKADSLEQAWAAINQVRVLCALHAGPEGQVALNAAIESALRARFHRPKFSYSQYFQGQLLMASRNDYSLGVMNGDVALVWPDANGALRFYIERGKELVSFSPLQLPDLQSAFATTVHKAQGSEFDQVILVLPATGAERVLHQALIYTAITRAKRQLSLIATPEVLRAALTKKLHRRSGFLRRLQTSAPK
jgi:exodeoxyribonuclease V alpha subunit